MKTPSAIPLNATVAGVTSRIEQRSVAQRLAYLDVLAHARKPGPYRGGLGCANMAHAFAAMPANDKLVLQQERQPNLGVITAYNDMLSAHQPYENYPQRIRAWSCSAFCVSSRDDASCSRR